MVSSVLMAASTIQINTRYLDPARGSSRLGFSEAVASAVRDDMLRRNCVRSVHLWLGGGPPPPEAYLGEGTDSTRAGILLGVTYTTSLLDGRVDVSAMSDKRPLFISRLPLSFSVCV